MGAAGLTAEELAAAKAYLRVEGEEDDAVVTACVLAAREYLAGAGVALPPAEHPRRALYNLAAHAIALGSYDLRDPVLTGSVAENPQLRRTVVQLKLTEPQG